MNRLKRKGNLFSFSHDQAFSQESDPKNHSSWGSHQSATCPRLGRCNWVRTFLQIVWCWSLANPARSTIMRTMAFCKTDRQSHQRSAKGMQPKWVQTPTTRSNSGRFLTLLWVTKRPNQTYTLLAKSMSPLLLCLMKTGFPRHFTVTVVSGSMPD